IRHQRIEDCRRVNVFIGYPNTGKSKILEALSLFEIGTIADVDFRVFLKFEIKFESRNKELQIRSQSNRMFFEMEVPLNDFHINAMAHGSKASDEYDS